MLKLNRNKIVVSAVLLLSVFLVRTVTASAAQRSSNQRFVYRTQLRTDLDGDHVPETATIRQWGSIYQVSIHFTSGRPKLRLRTTITDDVAGLSLQTADLNNDSNGDLVVLSATSTRPVAVWLNKGSANFQRVNPWTYGSFGPYRGPTVQHHGTDAPEPPANLSADPLSYASAAVEDFGLERHPAGLITGQLEQSPLDSALRQVPSRGPPATLRF